MFVANVASKPTSLKPAASHHTKPPAAKDADDMSPTNTGKTVTTDNSQVIAQKELVTEQLQDFSSTLSKKKMAETSRNTQVNNKTKKQDQNSGTLSEMIHPALSLAAQGVPAQPVALDKVAAAKALNQLQQQAKNQISGKPTDSNIAGSPKTPFLTAQTAKQIASEPGQIVSAAAKPLNKPIQPTIDHEQIKSEIFSPAAVSIKPDITSTPLSNRQNQQGGKELSIETRMGDSKITITSEKAAIADKPTFPLGAETTISTKPAITSTPLSNQQNQQSGEESTHKTLTGNNKITAGNEQSVVINKPSVPNSPKTHLSNGTFATPHNQSPNSQQRVLIRQESPASAAGETTPNKADTDQKDHRGKTELFESSEKNKIHDSDPSVRSVTQKMNPQRTQLSAPQVENRSNLLSNQMSNPDMQPGEQVSVDGNAQLGITEQLLTSSASTEFAKVAGNTDSGVSVSEQIQESIHSSFRSGNQQIVIRLDPPELGKVVVKFTEQDNDITGLLQVDKLQTRDQLQQTLPDIIQNLQNAGIVVKKFEVVLTNQQDQYALKDQSSTAGQDGWSGHQSSPNPQSRENNTIYSEWLTDADIVPEYMEPQVQLTDKSVNMLV